MLPNTKPLRKKFMENHLRMGADSGSHVDSVKEENIIEWVSLYRRNWHIFVDMVLQIKLKPFQMLMIYLMGISDVFFAICSRGLSKSFIVSLAAIVKMLLFPYSEIIITASTIPQANVLVEKKIRDELIKKLSPYLLYLYEKEYLVITKSDDGYKITCTLNGSTLEVLPALDSSRGRRATFLIYEECRLIKKSMIDSVFSPMAHPRQAKYLSNPVYANDKRWLEECQSIYITSARYKYEYFWNTFKETFTGYFYDKRTHYNIFAGDIFMSIDNGLKTWGDYRKSKKMLGEYDNRMENLNEMIGENEDAFFTIKSFKQNQIIQRCFRPPTDMDIYLNHDMGNPPKEDNEIRLVISDYAFANTTSSQKNDNTIIMCMSLHWKGNRFERHVDYIEGYPAGDSLGAADRAREIFWDYEADYLIPDLRSGGEALFNKMTMELENPNHGVLWDKRGLTVSDELELHVVPEGKLQDLRNRTVDKNAVPCIIPITGSTTLNSTMWIELRKQLDNGNIKFLVPMQTYQESLEDNGDIFGMTSEEVADSLLPYAQVDLLVNEAVNLKAEIKDGGVKLSEPKNGFKDRAVCLSYGNYIASKIENIWQRRMVNQKVDYTNIQLVW